MYIINDSCTACGTCEPECPVNAIKTGDKKYTITAECTDCGACAEVCPESAISAK